MYQSIRIGWKGSSETPLYFLWQYNGLSVGRIRRYRSDWLPFRLAYEGGNSCNQAENPLKGDRHN